MERKTNGMHAHHTCVIHLNLLFDALQMQTMRLHQHRSFHIFAKIQFRVIPHISVVHEHFSSNCE